jgi:hypothetical protein
MAFGAVLGILLAIYVIWFDFPNDPPNDGVPA